MTTRRAFLQQASTAAMLGVLTQLPARELWAAPLHVFLPEFDEGMLRALALAAIDAARTAGATFADVRVVATRAVNLGCSYDRVGGSEPQMAPPRLARALSYGVRTIVGGTWGFASGSDGTLDSITQTARRAVTAARANPSRRRLKLELAPRPVVSDGRWATPIAEDPFAVSIKDQGQLAIATLAEASRVPEVRGGSVAFEWKQPLIVFASSDGSLIVQRHTFGAPGVGVRVSVRSGEYGSGASVELPVGPYGYEAVRAATLDAELREAARRGVARAREATPPRSVEVGRYDLVLSPAAVARVCVDTLGEALNAERALGFLANSAGTSFAAPPHEMLGRYQIATKLMTVRADRSRPKGAATVGWDEEGVKPEGYTLVENGVIMDYHTDRQTAAELGDWYRGRRETVRAHGCARRSGNVQPSARVPNLTIEPGPGATTTEDLIKDVRRGFYLELLNATSDHQLINMQGAVGAMAVRQIVNGKLGHPAKDFAVQFLTSAFWKGVVAFGGRASARAIPTITDYGALGDPSQPFPLSTVEAVPALVRQVNVLNTGRTA